MNVEPETLLKLGAPILSSIAGAGFTWGVMSNRMQYIEQEVKLMKDAVNVAKSAVAALKDEHEKHRADTERFNNERFVSYRQFESIVEQFNKNQAEIKQDLNQLLQLVTNLKLRGGMS